MIKHKQTIQTINPSIRKLLELAHRAPSTHNIQPWLFKILPNTIEVYSNKKLYLPEGDPTRRDHYISLGCCLENLVLAAKHAGLYGGLDIAAGGAGPEATVRLNFAENASKDSELVRLVEAIPNRFNARGVFATDPVPEPVTQRLKALNYNGVHLRIITEAKGRERLAELTAEGLRRAYHRPAFRAEIAGWVRTNLSRKKDGIPGRSLRLPTLLSLVFPTLMRRVDIGQKLARLNYRSMVSAPAVFVIDADKDEPNSWVEVGRLAQRVFLELTAADMRASVFVAAVEIDDLYQQVKAISGSVGRPQYLFCGGFIHTPQRPTPRRPLEEVIL